MQHNIQKKNLTTALANNRTENIGMDVWEHFVVPRYFDDVDFYSAMPCKIEGGRGCGKTMLLRYLSYQSQFSANRANYPNEIRNIGLYWRADTQFIRLMNKRTLPEEEWHSAFEHYVYLKIAIEIYKAIEFLASNDSINLNIPDKQFSELEPFDDRLKGSFQEIKSTLNKLKKKLDLGVSNPKLLSNSVYFPYSFVSTLIEELKDNIPELKNTVFHLFVDEYENLLPYQQILINSRIKHSEKDDSLIFKVACKKNGMPIIAVYGEEEAIVKKHDYIVHDLDFYISNEFDVFASEVLLSRIDSSVATKFNSNLHNVDGLITRQDPLYIEGILKWAQSIFPGYSQKDLANDVFSKAVLKGKLRDMVAEALKKKNSSLDKDDFIFDSAKEASIVCTALLNRESTNPEDLKFILQEYESGNKNSFKDWIATNFVGCYLNIIKRKKDENRFYSGFDKFIALSQGNLRHFLELCRTSFTGGYNSEGGDLIVDQKTQCYAAEQTANSLFDEIKSFKPFGHKLHLFAGRIGELFKLSQDRLSQSEPEVYHFSIKGGEVALKHDVKQMLDECEKWGVLYKTPATKTKSKHVIDDYDLVLNPIYAPKFGISYRKKRKFVMTPFEVETLFDSDPSNYEVIFQNYKKKFSEIEKQFKEKVVDEIQPGDTKDMFRND